MRILPIITVYPRWRGEHVIDVDLESGCRGLSPLARGTQQAIESAGEFDRFIPAGAGNTYGCRLTATPRTVYPRWRGEHGRVRQCGWFFNGLSPLARGTH